MRKTLAFIATAIIVTSVGSGLRAAGRAGEPDYVQWNRILATYYDPVKGMDYAGLKRRDVAAILALRQDLGKVDASALSREQQLAYWINVYNINTVVTILEKFPVGSIRDISTDPIIRLNVFKKKRIPTPGGMLSLNDVENDRIRDGFMDPRIHFAINCAARSCPPLRTEAYVGDRVDAQLNDQARKFLATSRFETRDGSLEIHVTKILDWFSDDFEEWGKGRVAFIRRFVPVSKQRMIDAASDRVDLSFDDYDWSLNNWAR